MLVGEGGVVCGEEPAVDKGDAEFEIDDGHANQQGPDCKRGGENSKCDQRQRSHYQGRRSEEIKRVEHGGMRRVCSDSSSGGSGRGDGGHSMARHRYVKYVAP